MYMCCIQTPNGMGPLKIRQLFFVGNHVLYLYQEILANLQNFQR